MFRRDWPFFISFDLLWLNGRDLRLLPLIERKRMLRTIHTDHDRGRHIEGRGIDFYRAACQRDLEGIVAKWRHGIYQVGARDV